MLLKESILTKMQCDECQESVEWLIQAIRNLPGDDPVAPGTKGYNTYTTQKDHWLGWLDPSLGTGTYARKTGTGKSAREVYNRIVEPKMLAWLITAAEAPSDLIKSAINDAAATSSLASKSAAIRRNVPWIVVADALKRREIADST